MKFAVVLFSMMVIALNAVPCCWNSCDEMETVEHTGENSGAEDSCSPFLSCGSCAGFILQQELPNFISDTSPYRSINEYEDKMILFDYTRIIWAPPKRL